MPYATNDGNKIYYETHGEGQPLLFIMGLGGTLETWKYQIKYFCKYYKVIVMDNRGVGRSDKPDEEYSTAIFAEDVKMVLDSLNVKNAIVFGVSMGGMIAQEFSLSYPEYVKALIIGCSGAGAPDPYHASCSEEVLEVLELDRTQENRREVTTKIVERFYHPSFVQKIPDLVERILALPMVQPAYAYKRQLGACFLKEDISPRLGDIEVPTLIMHGDEDEIWPVQNAYNLKKLISHAQCEIIPQSGHMFFLEKPQLFNELLHKFLRSLK